QWFAEELERLRQAFEKGDYLCFLEALHLCHLNKLAPPDWAWTVVMDQAEKSSLNWWAKYKNIQKDKKRADLVEFHLIARRKRGRIFVSEAAAIYGYGKLIPDDDGRNIVTRNDIF